MAEFELALPTILKHEGKVADHPNDSGGATSYGISLRFLCQTNDLDDDTWQDGDINRDGRINLDDVLGITPDDAAKFYRLYFWESSNYSRIQDQSIATKCLDLAVNMGNRWANRVTQRAVRATIGLKLKEDGIIGNKTIHAINMCPPDKLMIAMRAEAAGHYRLLLAKQPKFEVFINGWLNRAYY